MKISSITFLLFMLSLVLFSASLSAEKKEFTITHNTIDFSQEEKIWIKNNPVVRVAVDPYFPPYEWRNSEGQYIGISIEYLNIIEKRTGIKFKYVQKKNWTDILKSFRQGEIDLLSAIAKTPEREVYMDFTMPHIDVPGVIITSKDFQTIQQLYGHRVAVVVDQIWDELITSKHFNINLVRVENIKDGVELASLGAVDAMVTDLASVTYILQKESIVNLRIINYLEKRLELGMAVQKENPELKSIIQKVTSSISKKDKDHIHGKWIHLDQPSIWGDKNFWFSVLAVILLVIGLLVIILIWNYSLRKLVEKRTKELQATQLQLIQAEKMDSIGRVATGIAHEVKNPLAIIQMGLEYLSEEYKENDDKEKNEIFSDINHALERAEFIINSFLDYSKESKLNLEKKNINNVINKTVSLLTEQLKSQNINCVLELSDQIGFNKIDENKIQQVFTNIILNSCDALKNQNTKNISIETCIEVLDNDELKCLHPNGAFEVGEEVVIIRISDSGGGVSLSNIEKIFEPFFTSKAVGEGTGLGLPVSQKIIQMHRGAMGIKNGQSDGTVVTIVLRLEINGDDR